MRRVRTWAKWPLATAVIVAMCSACTADAEDMSGDPGRGDVGQRLEFSLPLDKQGRSELIEIELPPDVVGFSVALLGEARFAYAVVELIDPDGTPYVEETAPQPRLGESDLFPDAWNSPNRSNEGLGRAAMLVPSSPALAPKGGTWKLRVAGGDYATLGVATGTVRGAIHIKRAAQPPMGGAFDLHIHLTGEPTHNIQSDGSIIVDNRWTAEGAAGNTQLQAALARTQAIYAELGIDVGIVSFHQLSPEFGEIAGVDSIDSERDEMFRAGQQDLPGINVFFVQSILGSGGGSFGIAANAPVVGGPGTVAGESRLGVVIGTDGGDVMANKLTHELGHFFGLYHTTEQDGRHDPIPDTAEDERAFTNVMHFRTTHRARTFSDDQAIVLYASPLIGLP